MSLKKRVLIVDDDNLLRNILKDIFVADGRCEVVGEACDGDQALEKFRELVPDLVTMDVNMPGTNGIEAIGKIRKEFPDAKIIVVTSRLEKDLLKQAFALGAEDYIAKPFEENRIQITIENVLFKDPVH